MKQFKKLTENLQMICYKYTGFFFAFLHLQTVSPRRQIAQRDTHSN